MTVTTGAAGHEILRLRGLGLDFGQFLFEAADEDLGAEVARDGLRRLGIERRVDRQHHPAIHELLEHVLDLDLELVGQILHAHAFGERDELGDGRRRFDLRRHRRTIVAPHARARARRGWTEWRTGAPGARRTPGHARKRRTNRLRGQRPRAAERRPGRWACRDGRALAAGCPAAAASAASAPAARPAGESRDEAPRGARRALRP